VRADHIGPKDMFKIGVGPSSSHTVGPMVAALEFRNKVTEAGSSAGQADLRLQVELYGSLSLTGRGHATDGAVCAGLAGLHPRSSPVDDIWAAMPSLNAEPHLTIGSLRVKFRPDDDILWHAWQIDGQSLPHPNTMRFRLYAGEKVLLQLLIASVGGGFVETVDERTGKRNSTMGKSADDVELPHPYNTAQEFVQVCANTKLQPWQIVVANQKALGCDEKELREHLSAVLDTMDAAINAGLNTDGILPGGLNVKRRAKELHAQMLSGKTPAWAGNDLRPSVYAMAVNEENAAGGRVVTAPTNGSSGIIPSVWRTLRETNDLNREQLENGLMVASVIGALVKTHASISGAEVGCQGEVGTSCAMAAGGAVAMLGGTPNQIEQAAEIGIEHHLGMTCDPMKGLVQVPCIERNAMGAVKALNAAALSLASDGTHLVSLDRVLQVMKETGLDMNQKYKETATGGLALG
jgi:L-serine dehydratase